MRALVFGGSGALGQATVIRLQADGFQVTAPAHKEAMKCLEELPALDAVVWAQGVNATDSVLKFDPGTFENVLEANVSFIARTLARLIELNRLNRPARLCLLSSIWQEQARTNKFSYTVSKAALAGLLRSCAADLGPRGILVNAVLPGVVDTPMTRENLSHEQIESIRSASPLNRFATPEDIANAVAFLVAPTNRVISGQSLIVDGGFTSVRSL